MGLDFSGENNILARVERFEEKMEHNMNKSRDELTIHIRQREMRETSDKI